MGTDALDIHSGLPFASKADDGRINKVLEMWSNQRTKFLSEKKNSVIIEQGCYRAKQIKINKMKFEFKWSEVAFIGHVMTMMSQQAEINKLVKYPSKFLTLQRLKKTILDGFPMQKMISQQPSFRATAEKLQAPPLADPTILPKQLGKATVAIPSKAQSLSVTSDKPQVVDARTTRSGPLSMPSSYSQNYAYV